MNILILEDEPLVAEKLILQVKKLRPAWTVLGPVASTREAREWLQDNIMPDLILADIQLSDGISLDLLHELKPGRPVIFTTAFDEYAIRAFKINSVDYLLKPVDPQELEAAFVKFESHQAALQNTADLQALLAFIHKPSGKAYKEKFLITQGQQTLLVPQANIAYFMKDDLLFLVQAEGGRHVTDYRSLDEIEELVDPTAYFRANRQYLVQRKFVTGFRSDDTGKLSLVLTLPKPPAITVSREKASLFRKWFEQ